MKTYKVKQIDWDLIENFDDRMGENFCIYADFKHSGSLELCNRILSKGWFVQRPGYIKANTMWDAYREGNIGERTFDGASISIGDILVDESGVEWVLTDNDFEKISFGEV